MKKSGSYPRRAEKFISASYIAKCYGTESSVGTETGGTGRTIIMKFKLLTRLGDIVNRLPVVSQPYLAGLKQLQSGS